MPWVALNVGNKPNTDSWRVGAAVSVNGFVRRLLVTSAIVGVALRACDSVLMPTAASDTVGCAVSVDVFATRLLVASAIVGVALMACMLTVTPNTDNWRVGSCDGVPAE